MTLTPNGISSVTHCSLSACSACAGDYEDPDRTARSEDHCSDEFESEEDSGTNRFERGRDKDFLLGNDRDQKRR